jgi:hypothetical protein
MSGLATKPVKQGQGGGKFTSPLYGTKAVVAVKTPDQSRKTVFYRVFLEHYNKKPCRNSEEVKLPPRHDDGYSVNQGRFRQDGSGPCQKTRVRINDRNGIRGRNEIE